MKVDPASSKEPDSDSPKPPVKTEVGPENDSEITLLVEESLLQKAQKSNVKVGRARTQSKDTKPQTRNSFKKHVLLFTDYESPVSDIITFVIV
ncbi:hypothetical protein J4Q44_G00150490, partial [Coregonus suidteri]